MDRQSSRAKFVKGDRHERVDGFDESENLGHLEITCHQYETFCLFMPMQYIYAEFHSSSDRSEEPLCINIMRSSVTLSERKRQT